MSLVPGNVIVPQYLKHCSIMGQERVPRWPSQGVSLRNHHHVTGLV
uniref:Uncharacterized protein n=1 Tax=Trichinella nativa TaxID=6335 RepID=A0A0V1KJ82_9BILA